MDTTLPAPALIVLGDGAEPRRPDPDAALEERLFARLPAAGHVLAVGIADGARAQAWRRAHETCRWQEANADGDLPTLDSAPELIVLGAGCNALQDPLPLLRALAQLAAPHTRLMACARNAAQGEMLLRLVEADLTPGEAGAWPAGSARHDSPSSFFKRLMDAGWMPQLVDQGAAAPLRADLLAAAHTLADAAGVPRRTAERTLGTDTMVVEAQLPFGAASLNDPAGAVFDVVVPTTRESQLRLNVEASPGLQEVGARIVSVRRARDPAHALEQSLAHVTRDWVLFCHQDVYFPSGFGTQLNALLAGVPREERARTLFGFAGMGASAATGCAEPAGFVIDRTARFDHAASPAAVSIDELAIVVARESIHRIDPSLGWHLWATDLCLTAIAQHRVFPRIVRLPLFHNSSNDFALPQAFRDSAAVLAHKHAGFGTIRTLCGDIAAP